MDARELISLLLDPELSVAEIAQRSGLDISQIAEAVRSDFAAEILSALRAVAEYRVALTVAQSLPDAAHVLARLAAREPATPAQAETSRKAAAQILRMRGSAPAIPPDPDGDGADPDDDDSPDEPDSRPLDDAPPHDVSHDERAPDQPTATQPPDAPPAPTGRPSQSPGRSPRGEARGARSDSEPQRGDPMHHLSREDPTFPLRAVTPAPTLHDDRARRCTSRFGRPPMRHLSRVSVASLAVAAGAAAAQDEPFFRRIPAAPGYVGGRPWAISADGKVVVGDAGVEGGFLDWHAFRWRIDSEMEILGSLHQDWNSSALAASGIGHVVVGDAVVLGPTEEAFRWTEADGMIGLGDLPGGEYRSGASGVSADGRVIVGHTSVIGTGAHAFRWTEQGGMEDLGTLPGGLTSAAFAVSADGIAVVGLARNADYQVEAFRWSAQTGMVGLGDLPGSDFYSEAEAVSADGAVVVGWGSSAVGPEAFRWTQSDGMVGLGFLGGSSSVANGVSADGAVVVGEATTNPRHRPFIWTAQDGMRNLQDIIQFDLGFDIGEFDELIGARAISADGRTIVGYGFTRDGQPDGWVLHLGRGCPGDINRDGVVDAQDVAAYLNLWAQKSILADWNYDAVVDTRDFIDFLNAWVDGC